MVAIVEVALESVRDVIDLFQSDHSRRRLSGPSIGKPTKRSLRLFFMVCYDTDRFREFVISEGFKAEGRAKLAAEADGMYEIDEQ